jgi:hypothetical protein
MQLGAPCGPPAFPACKARSISLAWNARLRAPRRRRPEGVVLSKTPPYSGWRACVEMWRGNGEFGVRPGHVPATSSTPIPTRESPAIPPGGKAHAARAKVTANTHGPRSKLAACTAAHGDASSAAKTLGFLHKVHGTGASKERLRCHAPECRKDARAGGPGLHPGLVELALQAVIARGVCCVGSGVAASQPRTRGTRATIRHVGGAWRYADTMSLKAGRTSTTEQSTQGLSRSPKKSDNLGSARSSRYISWL